MAAAVALTLGFAAVEAGTGWWAGSLALLGDAGHMATDALALGLAFGAVRLSRRRPSPRHSYGLGRAGMVAALLNAVLMLALVAMLTAAAVGRLLEPAAVRGEAVTVVALAGLAINLAVAWILAQGERTLNVRAALLHVVGDLLGSVAALVSGVVIIHTGWTPVDPILTLAIGALILGSSLRVLREALHGLLEGVPLHLSLEEVGGALAAEDGVLSVHDLHIWSLSAERVALSAHVVVAQLSEWPALLRRLQALLQSRFGIDHATLQPEVAAAAVPQPLLRRPRGPDEKGRG